MGPAVEAKCRFGRIFPPKLTGANLVSDRFEGNLLTKIEGTGKYLIATIDPFQLLNPAGLQPVAWPHVFWFRKDVDLVLVHLNSIV